jgi:branched-chain amino acid transport system substrate-binding protein
MDHFIGNWWSANDSDVVPAGRAPRATRGDLPRPGHQLQGARDLSKYVYDKGKGAGKKEEMGAPLYNRGIVNAMLSVEAIRTAHGASTATRRSPASRCAGASRT